MKKNLILVCVLFAVSLSGIGCSERVDKGKTAVDRKDTNSGGQSEHIDRGTKKAECKRERSHLMVEGGDTFDMDEYIQIWEKAAEEDMVPEHITLSEDIKYVKPLTKEVKSKWVDERVFYLSSLTLEGTSLAPDALFTIMNTFTFDRIFTRSGDGEPAKEYVMSVGEDMRKFYKTYISDLKEKDDMYIAAGILFFSEGKEKNVIIPDSVTVIGPNAFSAMSDFVPKLDSVEMSDSVTLIGRSAFDMQNLKKIKLGKQVREIGEEAFNGCELKADLVIPASVIKIGENSFGVSGGAKRIVIEGETASYSKNFCCWKNTAFTFAKGIQESFTTITKSYIVGQAEHKYYELEIAWNLVEGADGYEIAANVGGDYDERENDEYTLVKDVVGTQNRLKVKIPAPDDIDQYAYETGIKITPYQVIDGKRVYGRSTREVFED